MDATEGLLRLLASLFRLMRDIDNEVFLWIAGIAALIVFVALLITVVERVRARRGGSGAA